MEDFDRLYNKALRYLSYRPRSEREVKDYLKIKNHPSTSLRTNIKNLTLVIDKVIQKLKERKFINDEEFARWWIEQRSKFKPQGVRLTELELRQKGIDKELIDRLIHNSEFIIQNDLEQAKKLVEKKMGRFRNKFGMTREGIYQKLGRYLASKGFDWDTIKKAIDEVLNKGV